MSDVKRSEVLRPTVAGKFQAPYWVVKFVIEMTEQSCNLFVISELATIIKLWE